tara:strand:+ start:1389 stop:1796 length:408 start_codon:yes stop_codon:yes gene_type:complete
MAEDRLIEAAMAAREKSYSPYSGFAVGCAIESASGEIALGANMENASYPLGVCAEQAALAAAQQAFGLDNVVRMAIVGGPKGAELVAITPCGGCRQAIAEAATVAGYDIAVIGRDGEGNLSETCISKLLPGWFTF